MAEQWQIQWKDYYQVLQLQLDAEPEVIGAVYRKLAVKYHPDNKDTGDAAKFKELNEANEILGNPEKRAIYDKEYGRRQPLKETDTRAAENEFRRRAEAARREQAEQQQQEDRAKQQRHEEEQRRKQLPIVYPIYRGTSLWSVVNTAANGLVKRLGLDDGGAAVLGFFLSLVVLALPFALILRLLAFVLEVRLEELADSSIYGVGFFSWFGLGGACLWGNLIAIESLDSIHAARQPRTVWVSTSQVWPTIEQVLSAYRYHGHGWVVGEKTEDPDDAAERLVAACVFSYKLLGLVAVPYALTVTLKVKETDSVVASKVCYWFETRSPWYWLWPAATVVKQTNEALQKALPGPR